MDERMYVQIRQVNNGYLVTTTWDNKPGTEEYFFANGEEAGAFLTTKLCEKDNA